jgi:hypothetical protein
MVPWGAVIRIYALGSLAVRLEAWETITSLSLTPVPSEAYGTQYMFSSWIRHAQVDASRAGLTQGRNGFIISAARDLIFARPAMRPDIEDTDLSDEPEVAADDLLLNSLCEFDLAYCVIVFAKGQRRRLRCRKGPVRRVPRHADANLMYGSVHAVAQRDG